MELDIGRSRSLVRVPESASLEKRRGHGAGLEGEILETRPGGAMGLGDPIVGVVARAFGDRVQIQVILHVRADARQVMHDIDSRRLQCVRGADAGKLEKARRADRAATDDDLAVRVQGFGSRSGTTITPIARPFWTSIFSVWAFRRMVRFFRPSTGFTKADEAEERSALRVESW